MIRKGILSFCFCCWFVFSSNGQSDFEYNVQCKKAYALIFDLRFTEAQKILDNEARLNPRNGIPVYLQHYLLFLKAFISEEEQDFIRLKGHHEKAIEFLTKAPSTSPYSKFIEAEVNLLTAIVRLKFNGYISGALEVRRAFKLLEENSSQYPAFIPNLKGLGLMHSFIGAVPENYKWLLKLAGMNGSIAQGIGELKRIYSETKPANSPFFFLHREVTFVYLFSRQHLEKNPSNVLAMLNEVEEDRSPMSAFFFCNVYYSAGKNDSVIRLLNSMQITPDMYPFHYLTYMLGMAKLNTLDLSASTEFASYLSLYKGRSFIKSGWQKMAWIALINKDTLLYKQNLEKILSAGNDFTDEDKQALREAQENELPNVFLLKSRLLFDGGNFKGALTILAGRGMENFPSLKNKLELTYRLGRIYDRLGMIKNAMELYEKTIQNGKKFSWYFAANSCLHLAQIYENTNDKSNAERYYKMCLTMRNHEYQNSIDQKAKAGLNRLGQITAKGE